MALSDFFKPRWKHSDSWVRWKAVEKLRDQSLLADIARNDGDSNVRMAAALRLTDQSFAQPVYSDVAKNHRYPHVRIEAAGRLVNQSLAQSVYADIARNSEARDRRSAVRNLTDQESLAYVAKNDPIHWMREEAVERMTDQTLLADVIKNASNLPEWDWRDYCDAGQPDLGRWREAAIEKLTDQGLLADLAKNGSPGTCCKVTDQGLLADVAKNAEFECDCTQAVEKLTDQELLADIAEHDRDPGVRLAAAMRLKDQSFAQTIYADIAKNGSYSPRYQQRLANAAKHDGNYELAVRLADESLAEVRMAAARLVTDQALAQAVYADITKKLPLSELGLEAAKQLLDQGFAQSMYAEIARSADVLRLRMRAAELLLDQSSAQPIYADIVRAECRSGHRLRDHSGVQLAAVKKLADQTALADIAMNHVDYLVQLAAVQKLSNQSAVANIAENHNDNRVREVATARLTEAAGLARSSPYRHEQ